MQRQRCPVQRLPLDERPWLALLLHSCAARHPKSSASPLLEGTAMLHVFKQLAI